jgi:iron(III) transport system substrate-binding protein
VVRDRAGDRAGEWRRDRAQARASACRGALIARKPAHPHAAALFVDFILSPEGQAILEKGGYVPANLRLGSRAQKLPLKFVDPAVVLDESDKWKKLYGEIVLGNAR